MVLSALKEATREGWITNEHDWALAKAWAFVLKSVAANGNVLNAYIGWAIPAEQRKVNKMYECFTGFVPGVIIVAADEMTR